MILGKVRSQALSHLHRCLSQSPQFEANESVAIFPKGGLLVDRWFSHRHFIILSWQFTDTHLYSWLERGIVVVAPKCKTMTRSGLEPRLFDTEHVSLVVAILSPIIRKNITLTVSSSATAERPRGTLNSTHYGIKWTLFSWCWRDAQESWRTWNLLVPRMICRGSRNSKTWWRYWYRKIKDPLMTSV